MVATAVKDKLSTTELSALYDRIYDIADRLIKKHNPCNIHTETKPAKDLFFNPIFPNRLVTGIYCDYSYSSSNTLCCEGCKYWCKGCTVKALGCKLFLCQAVKDKQLQKRFRRLREYTRKHLTFIYYFPGQENPFSYSIADKYYASKEDWLTWLKLKE